MDGKGCVGCCSIHSSSIFVISCTTADSPTLEIQETFSHDTCILYTRQIRCIFVNSTFYDVSTCHTCNNKKSKLVLQNIISMWLREAFKKYLQKTYGIFQMLVDAPPPPLTYGKSATLFYVFKVIFWQF